MTSLADTIPFVALAAAALWWARRAPWPPLRGRAVFVLIITALTFLCSAATGRVDAADLRVLPLAALVPAALAAAFALAGRLRSPWLRLPLRISSGLLTLLASTFFLLLCAAQAACVRRPAPLASPDGLHLALWEFHDQGALGSSFAHVRVRPSWLPWATVVYSGRGSWAPRAGAPHSPELLWLDSSRLLVRYSPDDRNQAPCYPSAGSIEVVCEERR